MKLGPWFVFTYILIVPLLILSVLFWVLRIPIDPLEEWWKLSD